MEFFITYIVPFAALSAAIFFMFDAIRIGANPQQRVLSHLMMLAAFAWFAIFAVGVVNFFR